jgi:hypothetical protein
MQPENYTRPVRIRNGLFCHTAVKASFVDSLSCVSGRNIFKKMNTIDSQSFQTLKKMRNSFDKKNAGFQRIIAWLSAR